MKYIKETLVVFFVFTCAICSAQVVSNQPVSNQISGENPFMDASTNFNEANSIGKGLVFPRTDLTIWEFKLSALDGVFFPSAFDGMIVYNTATGSTKSGQGTVVSVTPGFYYFSNPTGADSITDGVWKSLGAGAGPTVPSASAIEVKTSDYTLLPTDETILTNKSLGIVKITLPAATSANKGKKYVVKKIDAGTGFVKVISAGGLIDNVAADTGVTTSVNWQGWIFQSNGTDWFIVGRI